MPVLALLMVAVFAFGVIVAMLIAAQHLEGKHLLRLAQWKIGRPVTVIAIADAFDPDRSMLWETQLPALRFVASRQWRGVSVAALHRYFERCVNDFPELFSGVGFANWIDFLRDQQLITVENDRACITDAGRCFLTYTMPAEKLRA